MSLFARHLMATTLAAVTVGYGNERQSAMGSCDRPVLVRLTARLRAL